MSEATPVAHVTKMPDKNFGVGSFKFNRWSAELDESQTLQDALEPTFFAGLAGQITGHDKEGRKGRGDIIEVRKTDSGLFAELIITEVAPGIVRTKLLRNQEPVVPEVPEDAPLTTRWNPGKKVHEVIRRSDKQVMAGDFQTKDNAVAWIADHIKTMSVAA